MGGTVQTAAGIAIAAVLGVATPASAIEPGPGASTGDDAFTIDMAAGEDPIGEVLGGNDTEVVGAARAWLLSEILLLAELDRFEASDLDPYLADVVGTAPLASPDRDRPDGPGGRLDSLAVVDTIGARLLSEMDRRGLAPSDAVRAALAPLPTVSTVDDPPDRATVSPDAHLWALTDLVLRQGAAPLDGRHLDDLDGTIEVLAEIRLDGPVTATEGWVDVIVASSPPPATLTGTGPEGSSTATAGRAAGTATVVAVVLVAAASAMALMLSLRRRSRTSRTPGVDSLMSLPDRRRLHSDLPGAVADPA
ncbi:MAG: hypothetical protein ACE5GB_13695, partial [Acidimicrobiales bacterium]